MERSVISSVSYWLKTMLYGLIYQTAIATADFFWVATPIFTKPWIDATNVTQNFKIFDAKNCTGEKL
jgi:hypothetical protein